MKFACFFENVCYILVQVSCVVFLFWFAYLTDGDMAVILYFFGLALTLAWSIHFLEDRYCPFKKSEDDEDDECEDEDLGEQGEGILS